MASTMHLDSLIQYTTLTATATKGITRAFQVPFLGATAALTLSIAKCIESLRSNKDECIKLLEQIHEILCIIVWLHYTSDIIGVLPTALLYDIANFTETLQKVYTVLNAQQQMGRIKRLFKQVDNAARLERCTQELDRALDIFKLHATGSTRSQVMKMRKDVKQQHQELLDLVAAYPDLTNSDHSSVTGTLSSFGNSSRSFSMLPPYPNIFNGRESELQHIVNILVQDSARIAILGAGGMGKTSLATAALHNAQVTAKYPHQYFVPCYSTASCAELVSAIADHIGIEKGSGLLKKIAQHFTHAPPSLVVLDNLETAWESITSRSEVEDLLALLTDVEHLGLLITMRGAERPAKVKWTHPFLQPLEPLSSSAALQTFMDVADDIHEESMVKQLLDQTGNMPLAVSLIASVAAYEGCDNTVSRWSSESTRMLSEGYDKRSSLDISIMLSFTSSRMTPGAQDLLGVLSMLPDGLGDGDLFQAKLPIANILACKATLLQTSLAFVDKDQKCKVLVPIREHVLSTHPPSKTLKFALRQHLHGMLDLWINFASLHSTDIVSQISQNLGNLHSVLLDALSTDCPDAVRNAQSMLQLSKFYERTQGTYSPLFLKLAGKISGWKDQQIFGEYQIRIMEVSHLVKVVDVETKITLGNQYFHTRPKLEQAKWYNALGHYYEIWTPDKADALECYKKAVSLSDMTGSHHTVAQSALCSIANIMSNTGNILSAQQYAQKAEEYAEQLGDIYAHTAALYIQVKCQMRKADYRQAQSLIQAARDHLMSCGLQGCALDVYMVFMQAEIHLLKTQYLESRQLQSGIASSSLPTSYGSILAKLNIAVIDTATGIDSARIHQNLNTCQLHIQSSLLGHQRKETELLCETGFADLYLRDGDPKTAYSMFAKCFTSYRDTLVELALFCAEKLANISTSMNNVPTALGWVGIFLALAIKSKNKLPTMKAMMFFGQICVSQGDDATALSLFNVALDGFTFMDVHQWRAECMVQIADISEQRGELTTSIELLKAAKPLFERSSQANDVARITRKLSAAENNLCEE